VNRLADETSPYLRQHRDNPVDWYPWGPEAFAEATARDVPVLLSVGYSSCHWCHVMAHQSFEDPDVAALMNRSFVNVKVDREERPDIDAIYMDAVQAMTGRGGWPMTVWLTPTGEPFYGGTYFPKDGFVKLIEALDVAWRERRADLVKNVGALRQAIGRTALAKPGDQVPPATLVPATVAGLAKAFDTAWGGFGKAPKFPSTMTVDLVLSELLHRPEGDQAIAPLTTMVTTTLDAMASGGMYDHIGGGFARYSVDDKWLVPHFEKMLYDQALLVRLYARAASALADRFDTSRWRQVASETVEFVLGELRQPAGGFSSALDADSTGPDGHQHEGIFTTWTPDEVRAVLGADADAAIEWYGITDEGNFAEPGEASRSIPNRLDHRGELARPPEIEAARRRLYEARSQRPRPGLDDKVVTEWNALMVAALAEAGALLGEPAWIDAAATAGRFLLDELRDDDRRWFRTWHADGEPRARHLAVAADHTALLDAFTRLAEATGEASWVYEAMDLADEVLDRFWDPVEGGLYTTANDGEALIARQKDLFDNATPSANSAAAVGLYRLAALTDEQRYANHADRILQLLGPMIPKAANGFVNALSALSLRHRGITEVVVAGDRPDLVEVVRQRWRPDVVLAWGERYESPLWEGRDDGLAYVCRQFTCQAPQSDPDGLRGQLP